MYHWPTYIFSSSILGNVCIRSHSASSLNNLSNQLSGSSSPSNDIAVSSLGQLKGWILFYSYACNLKVLIFYFSCGADSYDLHLSKKNCEEHLSPNNSLILANTKGIEFARKTSANDISENITHTVHHFFFKSKCCD